MSMLFVFALILVALLVIVGGKRGLLSFASLLGNMLLLLVTLYLSAYGMPALFMMIVSSAAFITLTLLVQNGRNDKTYATLISSVLVFALVSIFAVVLTHACQVAGYSEVDLKQEFAMYFHGNIRVSMYKVTILVVMLGMLGAIMDAAMTIATSVYEIQKSNETLTKVELIHSGMRVGRDIMGTTVNTLFFATVGEMAMLSILLCEYHYTFAQLINSKALVQQYVTICMANIGCLMVIPVTAVITTKYILDKKGVLYWVKRKLAK